MNNHRFLATAVACLGICLVALGHPAPASNPNADPQLVHVSGDGDPAAEAPSTPTTPPMDPAELEALMAKGLELYVMNCSACHGANGQGGVGPAHAGNQNLADTQHVLHTIHEGKGFMPPFAKTLNDEQIAAVATYIRNAWGNDFGPVTPEESAALR